SAGRVPEGRRDVRHLHYAFAIRRPGPLEHFSHRLEHPLLLVARQEREVAARPHVGDDLVLRRPSHPLREVALDTPERVADRRILDVAAEVVAICPHRRAEVAYPWDTL